MSAPLPENEADRIKELNGYGILDTPPEAEFDDLVKLASAICQVPMAMVSLVDTDRQWFKARVGIETQQTSRDVAFCAHVILGDEVMEIPDATRDPRFDANPLVTGDDHIRFYAGMPLRGETGTKLGTLCVVDRVPHKLSDFQRDALRVLGQQVEARLELRLRVRQLEDVLKKKKELARFIVHDLQNPLAGIKGNAEYLASQETLDKDAVKDIVEGAQRLEEMIASLLAVTRADDGLVKLQLAPVALEGLVEKIRLATVQRAAAQGQSIQTFTTPVAPLQADARLLYRVLGNLVDNSLKYGKRNGSIQLELHEVDQAIELRVEDDGPGIPAGQREMIFEKGARLDRDADTHAKVSFGLGLTFCRVAVEAHGGKIWVEDAIPHGAAFCVRLPLTG